MKIILFILFFSFSAVSYSQELISGRVTDENTGAPLPGAQIKTVPGNAGTLADEKGNFSVHVKPGDVRLEVVCIGYKATRLNLPLPAGVLSVKLAADENLLQEVMVYSGYQSLPKERSTGSFSVVGSAKLTEQVSTDILSRLPAVAGGLMANNSPTSGGELMIRGLSTIRGPKSPLIVLDNFPYEGDINNINPNDIESVTVLKDAAASSIWGARAGNGVIVLNTKKGSFNRKISVDVSSAISVAGKPDLGYIPQISSSDFIDLEEFLYKKGFYTSRINSSSRPPLSPVLEELIKVNGNTEDAGYKDFSGALRSVDVRDQFEKYFYQNTLRQQYAATVRGGTAVHNWLASVGHDRNAENLDEKYRRTNIRFNNTLKPLDGLELTGEIRYTRSDNAAGRPGYGEIGFGAYQLYPYARFADDGGNALALPQRRQGYLDTVGSGRLLDWNYYPLDDYRHVQNKVSGNDVLINAGVSYQLFKGLSADLRYQFEQQHSEGRNLRDGQSYYARNLINSFTEFDETGKEIHHIPEGAVLSLSDNSLASHNVRGQLNYQRDWARHRLNLMGGAERREVRNKGKSYGLYGYDDAILTYGYVDYDVQYPNYVTGQLAYVPSNYSLSDNTTRFVSFYANGAYTYDNRYTLSASARRDASNLFGLNTNDKWKPLWSVGGSWDISREAFYSLAAVPQLRLRATYGFSGNIDPAMSAVTTIAYTGSSLYVPGASIARFDNYANPDLTWETLGTFNLGLDFSIAANRVTGSIDYYRKKGKDLFGTENLDYTGGIRSILKNSAGMKGKGLDVELNVRSITSKAFQLTTQLNLSYNKDEITDYQLPSLLADNFISVGSISGVKGTPVYSVYSYKWAGLDPQTGDPLGLVNGEVSKDYTYLVYSSQLNELSYSGPALPVVFGSVGNTISYKGLSLTARVTYKLGYYFRKESVNYNSLINSSVGHSDYAKRWQQPGDEKYTNVPSLVYPNNSLRDAFYTGSDAVVEKGDHIRLQYVNLSYDLSRNKVSWLPVSKLSLFVNASNLGIIWRENKQNLDPDYRGGYTTPPPATYSFGLRASIN